MNRIKLYVDLAFCLVFLPVMIIIFPVERWFYNFPVYTLCVGAWLYASYIINRAVTTPLMFGSSRLRWSAAGIVLLSVAATYALAAVKLYEPKPHLFDQGIVRHLPSTEQYQQCIWSLFVIIQFFSLALGITIQYANQRSQWLLQTVNEMQARQLLAEENQQMRQQLNDTPAPADNTTITLKSGYQNIPVDTSQIIMLEAMENYVKVYRKDKTTIIAQTSMRAMEQLLGNTHFMRVHRSYIVSKPFVEKYNSRQIHLHNTPTPIPVGRKYTAAVQHWLET